MQIYVYAIIWKIPKQNTPLHMPFSSWEGDESNSIWQLLDKLFNAFLKVFNEHLTRTRISSKPTTSATSKTALLWLLGKMGGCLTLVVLQGLP